MLKKTLLIVLTTIFFLNCNRDLDQFNQFQKAEISTLTQNIQEILTSMKYEKYKILIIPHVNFSKSRISEKKVLENFNGKAIESENPPEYGNTKNDRNEYYKRDLTVNYDTASKEYIYNIDYFSVLIIFDKIDDKKKNQVTKLIEKVVLNMDKGDTVEIISLE
ncbi:MULTISPECIES: hypothetical protein [Leptospira]|uniref:Uncharacterized protein n=1 Tax=Leptospira kirschneri serovar Pomona TaxID=561005 RepID=A0A1T1DJX1_9LEPT|nr:MULTISPECIES: hypothetical protein [Leptospira]EMK05650.1 hypothetical protein LEP1GSC166_1805 [Leptospira kirschneri]KXZ26147.1 hypothetical protein AYB32_17000 [Leptospira kirschneri]KXZ30529.1 hypothetical protein AYB34_16360 [Leptospira sp. ZV016]OOV41188.1 hypothetical protein B1J93_13960 [Leptospira kirschneri serovar Pomona]